MAEKDKIQMKREDEGVLEEIMRVDLSSDARDVKNIGKQWTLEITPAKSLFNIFKSPKKIDYDVKLSIENILFPECLDIDIDQMLTILYNGYEYEVREGQKILMNLKGLNTNFLLFFNQNCIRDCSEIQTAREKKYKISFDVRVENPNKEEICKQRVVLSISFLHLMNTPEVSLNLKDKEVRFSNSMQIQNIGYLSIANTSQLVYLPSIDCDCEIIIKRNGDIVPQNQIWLDTNGLELVESDIFTDNKFTIRDLKSKISGAAKDTIKIPIFADIDAIGNPCEAIDGKYVFDFNTILKYKNSNEPSSVKQLNVPNHTFTLLKNAEQPSLQVSVQNPLDSSITNITESKAITLNQVYFLPGSNLTLDIPFTLSNLATEGKSGSGVVISNLDYEVSFNLGAKVIYATQRDNDRTLISLKNVSTEKFLLKNVENSNRMFHIIFNGDCLRELYIPGEERNYNVDINIKIFFDYCLDEDGKSDIIPGYFDKHLNHYEGVITLPVYQQPNPNWLAVDFGTSAIVSQYGNEILDLHKQKNELFNSQDEDTYEVGTPFLSSNIIFRNVSMNNLNEESSQLLTDHSSVVKFDSLALCLSPTSTFEKANIQNVIPCLKLIVGYDLIPNIEYYGNFQYQYKGLDGDILSKQKLIMKESDGEGGLVDYYTPLAKVDNIFGEVYKQLFSYYLSPAISEDARKINQLILTIPNTYTPLHMQRIRQIVKESLKDINIRNIRFVNESDAVACYYQNNWYNINLALKRQDNIALQEKERVLVYDMGAGTLDVTYFIKEQIDNKVVIKVIGKIGIAKAGNYLDCLIAQLLAKKISALENFANPDKIDSGDRVKAAFTLKAIIKNKIKPALSSGLSTLIFEENREIGVKKDVEIDIKKDILETEEFTSYVNEVTTGFLSNFFRFFTDTNEKNIKIDTVIMSGRSAKLKAIQRKLGDAMKEWGAPEMKVIDLSTRTNKNSQFDTSKTAVVEGAVNFAKLFGTEDSSVEFCGANIVASYGVIYKSLHGKDEYKEILNPRINRPTLTIKKDGITINTYETEEVVLDLSSTSHLLLVQTYSSDTQRDWQMGNHEYITLMSQVDVASLSNRKKVKLQLIVDDNNIMMLKVNGMQRSGISTSKIDINSKSNKLSLWPVLKLVNN